MKTSQSLFATLSIVILTVLPPLLGAAPVAIESLPFTIKEPGEYRVTKDLEFAPAAGAAITIAASDVVLDLGGHRISGTGGSASSAAGISALDRSRVTIRHGTISGFYFGIDLRRSRRDADSPSGHRIEGVILERNWYFGLRLEGTDSLVSRCEVRDTGGTTREAHPIPHGIRLVGAGNTLAESRILDLRLKRWPGEKGEIVGVHFDDARGSALRDTVIREDRGDPDEVFPDAGTRPRRFAVWVNGGPDGNTFLTVTGNTFAGFDVALAFSRDTDGEVKDNLFAAIPFDPIRGKPAPQLAQNKVQAELGNLQNHR